MSELKFDDHAVIHGVQVKAIFFDGDAARSEQDLVRRVLPPLTAAPTPPTVLVTEEDRKNFYCGLLVAQPDTVLAHGRGLICVEYKFVGYRNHTRSNWRNEIRLPDMLQNIVSSYVVAQSERKVTACVLRYHNVLYLLTPGADVVQRLLDMAPLAMTYYAETRRVAAAQLAKFSSARIQELYPREETARAAEGKVAHKALLRRD